MPQPLIDTSSFAWPDDTRGAVSLTYDDALPCHFEVVAPAWETHGVRVTFYTQINNLFNHHEAWRAVAAAGHELGNHSIFHPCRKRPADDWIADEYDLKTYTPRRWSDEMRVASSILSSVDGKIERSFGNNCCDNELGEGPTLHSLEPLIEELFVAGRGCFVDRAVDVSTVNFNALGHYGGDARDFERLRNEIDDAVEAGRWMIYMIHGVGEGTHNLFIDPDVHERLVDYLGQRQDSIWTAPVATVARYLRDRASA
jgi:hypothetical protein